ncbi:MULTISPECIES: 4'-phosphopantetheinyl transferase superfamily protein [unclassified Bradyrhizobium]|uniref:4'-phosphopantetheinyl transferase family protein n=1 Tax=unclassified Bradyrhizobium TaxID=2631580 RepID=UPI001BA5A224|nr:MULTISPECIES: 4'-phosphopantetheinyl transferase superfamily protein [unclassified Bradyrhizobium]MBR1205574.1 4'-phosphopantetheinyl transferase superfamily protein [Bradyrhizobium sp. AUGA SZCCT0124]MBR1313977.1 4'-phosphopantetheinyl transferase superfamily protein [Bradyrhizobium sp. AUGA SZCCT0051]MBR1337901.1 4'-phosphopantetheinyl transferase superfamily protein [Bradyrhizobium sp. AUGA SZCCT0105]MBR1355556.1 4'-phosphopantetheinyl transferase superfamily protein [Bradyrhizobium sp. A
MTLDWPELDLTRLSGAGGADGRGALALSQNFHVALARSGPRLLQPAEFDVSQTLVEPAASFSCLLDKGVELRAGIIVPVLEDDGLEVLACMLDVKHDIIRGLGAFLNEAERRRGEGLKSERDRRRFIVSRGQLRQILASRLGVSPSDVELEYGRLGKPQLSHRMPSRNLHFSVSRSEDLAVVALSTGQEIGVDIEAVLPVPEADEIAALCFSASDYESYAALGPDDQLEGFFRRWTRLEAISKGLGCGLGYPSSWDEKDWVVRSFVPKTGYLGSVVVRK